MFVFIQFLGLRHCPCQAMAGSFGQQGIRHPETKRVKVFHRFRLCTSQILPNRPSRLSAAK